MVLSGISKNKLTISLYERDTDMRAIINKNRPILIVDIETTNNTTKILILSIVLDIKLSIKLFDDFFKYYYKLLSQFFVTKLTSES